MSAVRRDGIVLTRSGVLCGGRMMVCAAASAGIQAWSVLVMHNSSKGTTITCMPRAAAGNGDVLEPHDNVMAIGSGSPYAVAAARCAGCRNGEHHSVYAPVIKMFCSCV
jgi:hypothetical protein